MRTKRVLPRAITGIAVTLRCADGSCYAGTIRNLSVGGAFVELPAGSPSTDSVTAEFSLGSEKLSTPAKIMWRRPEEGSAASYAGVRFDSLNGADAARVAEFIEQQFRRSD